MVVVDGYDGHAAVGRVRVGAHRYRVHADISRNKSRPRTARSECATCALTRARTRIDDNEPAASAYRIWRHTTCRVVLGHGDFGDDPVGYFLERRLLSLALFGCEPTGGIDETGTGGAPFGGAGGDNGASAAGEAPSRAGVVGSGGISGPRNTTGAAGIIGAGGTIGADDGVTRRKL